MLSNIAFTQESNGNVAELKHYMPLYLDMPAELNVKKGFKEINLAFGYADFKDFKGQRALLEYDFAPIDRLGFEIEVPFIFVQEKHTVPSQDQENVIVSEEGGSPESANALRIGFIYSLYSNLASKTTLAAGYFNELEFTPFAHFGNPLFEGNVYNPFVSVAKIWGNRFHTMIYTGTATKQSFEHHASSTAIRFNTIVTYRFGKNESDSFIGVECNQTWANDTNGQMVLRPQAQIQLTGKWKIGLVASLPVATSNHLNGSGFMRIIYSPN